MNYKYFRIKSVDVALSTAQTLPLSPDQIGLAQDQINPQDMMNPILYKAVSNDSWSTLEYRLRGLMYQGQASGQVVPAVSGTVADVDNVHVTEITDEHGVYYSLLSNRDGFRVAHPQQGLRMKGLRPIVFQKLYADAINKNTTNLANDRVDFIKPNTTDDNLGIGEYSTAVMRGRAVPMPRINTTYLTGAIRSGSTLGTNHQGNGMGNGLPANFQIHMPDIPPVMLGAIVLPPVTATTGILYYRMVCRAFIEFTDVRPMTDISSFDDINTYTAPYVYHSDYGSQSKSMDALTDMVDVKNAEIEKIMEGR